MPWIVADVCGQYELLHVPAERREPTEGDDGFVHLPDGVRDSELIDPGANLQRWLAARADALALEQAQEAARDVRRPTRSGKLAKWPGWPEGQRPVYVWRFDRPPCDIRGDYYSPVDLPACTL